MRSHVTSGGLLGFNSGISFNTASGMRSHVTVKVASSVGLTP